MAEKYTISVSEGEVNLKHNIDREYAKSHSNEYIDLSRSHLNRTIIMDERLRSGMTVEEAFNDEFSEAVSEYNSTKKKSRDKIKNYYEKVNSMKASGHKMKAVHEIVLQIGNMENNGVANGENVEALADILDTQIKQFQEDYPDIIIWYAVGHMDEATYHVHLGYSTTVFNPDAKRGLKYKISQNECLENMGITRGTATIKNKHGQDIERTRSLKEMFYDDMKDRIEDEMIEHGFTREIKDLHEQHLSPSNYRTKRLYEDALGRDIQSKQRENAVKQRENEVLSVSMNITEREKAVEQREIAVSEREKNINEIENKTIEAYRDYDKKRTQVLMQLNSVNDSKTQLRSMILNSDDTLKNEFLELHKDEFDKFIDDKLSIDTSKPKSIENPEYEIKRKRAGKHAEAPVKPVEPVKEEIDDNTPIEPVKAPEQPVKHREDDMKSILRELELDEDYDNPQDALNAYFSR